MFCWVMSHFLWFCRCFQSGLLMRPEKDEAEDEARKCEAKAKNFLWGQGQNIWERGHKIWPRGRTGLEDLTSHFNAYCILLLLTFVWTCFFKHLYLLLSCSITNSDCCRRTMIKTYWTFSFIHNVQWRRWAVGSWGQPWSKAPVGFA